MPKSQSYILGSSKTQIVSCFFLCNLYWFLRKVQLLDYNIGFKMFLDFEVQLGSCFM